jgi:hypothetical protein
MDLLCSLGLKSLPEQATRLTIHPGIVKTLEENSDVRLGFSHCCNCGEELDDAKIKVVKCKGCQRVSYCSKSCMKQDSEEVPSQRGNEEDTAFGHSAVICSLLKLCNDDENAEDELFDDSNNKVNDVKLTNEKQGQAKDAALYRVQTEQESYPATLFNVLAESPTWFMEAMTRRIRYLEDPRSPVKQRRGKRDRSAISPNKQPSPSVGKKQLVIHIVGASTNSELWGWDGKKEDAAVLEAYAEASTNLLSYFENFPIILASVQLIFIGPDCPASSKFKVSIPDSKTILMMETHCCNYKEQNLESVPSPDVIVFFNPGFSCPDYNWTEALSVAASPSKAGSTPFVVTTNTEMEGFADIQCLLGGGYIDSESIPDDILEAIEYDVPKSRGNIDDADMTFFFGENPYHGLRVRQSGTMANDVFVKSMWMFGGLFQKNYRSNKSEIKESNNYDDEEAQEQPRKKHRSSKKGKGNNKKSNPALI